MKKKPTLKDFEFFKKCCLEFADKWELNNWTFRFHFKRDKNEKFEGGKIIRYLDTYQAEIYLDPNYLTNREDIKQTAKHEMVHCILGTLYILGRSRYITESEIDREEEALTHKLEKLLK